MRRKSPYRHDVREHKRSGKNGAYPVHKYKRGKGDEPPHNPRRRRVVGGMNPGGLFDVSVFYVGEASERFSVDAKDYGGALGEGIESRDKSLPPETIKLRKVS